jgi:hypothetical protein
MMLELTVAHKGNVINKSDIKIQIPYFKFKFITPNSNSSLQIQIHHSKFKFITPNSNFSLQIQISHSKFKFLTSNSNFSLQIQISHSKFKFLTSNSNFSLQIQIHHWSAVATSNKLQYFIALLVIKCSVIPLARIFPCSPAPLWYRFVLQYGTVW